MAIANNEFVIQAVAIWLKLGSAMLKPVAASVIKPMKPMCE